MGVESTPGYELLYDIIRRRSSIRKLKPDPIPDENIQKIIEAGRWAMSGATSKPWEYIVVVGDGRRQWGTVQGAHTFGRDQSHLTDGLANTCTFMHLAAVSLGLATQWVTIHV